MSQSESFSAVSPFLAKSFLAPTDANLDCAICRLQAMSSGGTGNIASIIATTSSSVADGDRGRVRSPGKADHREREDVRSPSHLPQFLRNLHLHANTLALHLLTITGVVGEAEAENVPTRMRQRGLRMRTNEHPIERSGVLSADPITHTVISIPRHRTNAATAGRHRLQPNKASTTSVDGALALPHLPLEANITIVGQTEKTEPGRQGLHLSTTPWPPAANPLNSTHPRTGVTDHDR